MILRRVFFLRRFCHGFAQGLLWLFAALLCPPTSAASRRRRGVHETPVSQPRFQRSAYSARCFRLPGI